MADHLMMHLARNWWALAVRGAVTMVFGLLALLLPGLTLSTLVLLFGVFALVEGTFSVVAALRSRREPAREGRWWALLLEGLLAMAAGVATFVWPRLTALTLVMLIAAWAVISGALQIATAVRLRKVMEGEWLLALSGVASILFGGVIFIWPGAGALALVWLIGAYAVVAGALMASLSLRLRRRQAFAAPLRPVP